MFVALVRIALSRPYTFIVAAPVSYTHLDVYKRQVFECLVSGTISSGRENSISISATDTPCFWHLARLPAS